MTPVFRFCRNAVLLVSLVVPGQAARADVAPADTVNALHAALSEAMSKGPKLGCDGRGKALAPAVDAAYNLPFIAERALRKHWKTLKDDQRTQFTAALRNSVINTYATEFGTPGSVKFETGKTDAMANGDAVVHSQLLPKEGSAVTLDYVLKKQGERWQIVNVLAEGVSDLALRAAQYDGIMKGEGFTALLAKLDAQTQAQKARCK